MIGAWLSVVKEQIDALIEGTPLGKNVLVQLMPSGKPSPKAGEFFIAIHYQGLDTQLLETNGSVQQEISIGITISQRTRWSPEDRDGDRILLRSLDSLAAFSTAIVPLVHLNFGLVSGVDSSPLLGPHTQAVEPLLLESISGPEERDKSWWMNPESTDLDMQPVGFSMTLNFGGGLTITKLGCVTAQEDFGEEETPLPPPGELIPSPPQPQPPQ
jgi:hypothetical protein